MGWQDKTACIYQHKMWKIEKILEIKWNFDKIILHAYTNTKCENLRKLSGWMTWHKDKMTVHLCCCNHQMGINHLHWKNIHILEHLFWEGQAILRQNINILLFLLNPWNSSAVLEASGDYWRFLRNLAFLEFPREYFPKNVRWKVNKIIFQKGSKNCENLLNGWHNAAFKAVMGE